MSNNRTRTTYNRHDTAEDETPLIPLERLSSEKPVRLEIGGREAETINDGTYTGSDSQENDKEYIHRPVEPLSSSTNYFDEEEGEANYSRPTAFRSDRIYNPVSELGIQLSLHLKRLLTLKGNSRDYERLLTIVLALMVIVLLSMAAKDSASSALVQNKIERMQQPLLNSNVPLDSFRANLREERAYVTSFAAGGFTNQLIILFKLIHLANRLDRTAIIDQIVTEFSTDSRVSFSSVFELSEFSFRSNVSIVEWTQLKRMDAADTVNESLSCWGWWDFGALQRFNIETTGWPPPPQLTLPVRAQMAMSFPAMEVLASQPIVQREWLQQTKEKLYWGNHTEPPFPEQKVLCFENLFFSPSLKFVSGAVDQTYTIEEMSPEDPVWNKVGVHLKFNDKINKIADELLKTTLGSTSTKFLAVHLRQGDFVTEGRIGNHASEMYEKGVQRIQAELKKLKKAGKKGLPVVFTTDSQDAAFLSKLKSLGWLYVDHTKFDTTRRFAKWYPGLLDSVILSRATGFVGTRQSTFSYVAARRVESWNQGVTTIVG